MAERIVLIIGAGVAGLTAGCYLQMNGYPTTIFEMGRTPGGACTAWERADYTFDGCLQWLPGALPYSPMHQYWLEVGALREGKATRFTAYKKTEYAPDAYFTLYTDADWLSAELLRIAPADARAIAAFIRTIKRVARSRHRRAQLRLLAGTAPWLSRLVPYLLFARIPMRYNRMTIAAYARRFQTPVLRTHFAELMALSADLPVAMLFVMAGWMHAGGAGYPSGGSLAFARAIETHFRRLGGQVRYQSRVRRICVANGRAVGVELENGEGHDADIVVSAADAHDTLYRMLGGRFVDADSARRFGASRDLRSPQDAAPDRLFAPHIQVSLGVDHILHETAPTASYLLPQPLVVDDLTQTHRLQTRIYANENPYAAGKTIVTVLLPADYDYWQHLATTDSARYQAEKQRLARAVVAALCGPRTLAAGGSGPAPAPLAGLADQVEVVDVMTPSQWHEKTNNYRASPRGWLPAPRALRPRLPYQLPHLRGFYRVGHWIVPGGGLPAVLWTSRQVAKSICRRDGRRFTIRT